MRADLINTQRGEECTRPLTCRPVQRACMKAWTQWSGEGVAAHCQRLKFHWCNLIDSNCPEIPLTDMHGRQATDDPFVMLSRGSTVLVRLASWQGFPDDMERACLLPTFDSLTS